MSDEPSDVDYSAFARQRDDGKDAVAACVVALAEGRDTAFAIRMLRAVFDLEFARARDLVATLKYEQPVERLFSYGTLQQENVQIATFGRALHGVADELLFHKREMIEIADEAVLATSGERFHPIVTRTRNKDDRVPGTVFEVSPAELAAADLYEVSDYARASAQLASGLTAWIYVKRA